MLRACGNSLNAKPKAALKRLRSEGFVEIIGNRGDWFKKRDWATEYREERTYLEYWREDYLNKNVMLRKDEYFS